MVTSSYEILDLLQLLLVDNNAVCIIVCITVGVGRWAKLCYIQSAVQSQVTVVPVYRDCYDIATLGNSVLIFSYFKEYNAIFEYATIHII